MMNDLFFYIKITFCLYELWLNWELWFYWLWNLDKEAEFYNSDNIILFSSIDLISVRLIKILFKIMMKWEHIKQSRILKSQILKSWKIVWWDYIHDSDYKFSHVLIWLVSKSHD